MAETVDYFVVVVEEFNVANLERMCSRTQYIVCAEFIRTKDAAQTGAPSLRATAMRSGQTMSLLIRNESSEVQRKQSVIF